MFFGASDKYLLFCKCVLVLVHIQRNLDSLLLYDGVHIVHLSTRCFMRILMPSKLNACMYIFLFVRICCRVCTCILYSALHPSQKQISHLTFRTSTYTYIVPSLLPPLFNRRRIRCQRVGENQATAQEEFHTQGGGGRAPVCRTEEDCHQQGEGIVDIL